LQVNDGTNLLYYLAKFGGNRKAHVGLIGQSVMFFIFCHDQSISGAAALLQQIVSAFVGRYRRGLYSVFFGEEKPFLADLI